MCKCGYTWSSCTICSLHPGTISSSIHRIFPAIKGWLFESARILFLQYCILYCSYKYAVMYTACTWYAHYVRVSPPLTIDCLCTFEIQGSCVSRNRYNRYCILYVLLMRLCTSVTCDATAAARCCAVMLERVCLFSGSSVRISIIVPLQESPATVYSMIEVGCLAEIAREMFLLECM